MLHRHLPFLALTLVASAAAQTARPEVRLNPNGFNGSGTNAIDGVSVVVHNGHFFACWAEQNGTAQATQDIWFSSSSDDGVTWSTEARVDTGDAPNATDSDLPKMVATDSGALIVVWEEKRDAAANGSSNEDVFYNRSSDGGVTWLPAALPLNDLTAGADITSDVDRIWITTDGESVHCVWEEDPGSERLMYNKSDDAGVTWAGQVELTDGTFDVDDPTIAASGGSVIIAYAENSSGQDRVTIRRSINGGDNFDNPAVIESQPNSDIDEARIVAEGSLFVVTWHDKDPNVLGGEHVRCTVSDDFGATWRSEVLLAEQAAGIAGSDCDSAVTTIQGDNIIISYDEDSLAAQAGNPTGSSGNECYVSVSNDRGMTWTKDIPLAPGINANRPLVAASSKAIVAWIELNPNGSNIPAFTYSTDGGQTWAPSQEVPGAGPDVDEGNGVIEGPIYAVSELTGTMVVGHFDNTLGQNEVYASAFSFVGALGERYCDASVQLPNSTGTVAMIHADGNALACLNDFSLTATGMPADEIGYFLFSTSQDVINLPAAGLSDGVLCLGSGKGRFNGVAPNQGMVLTSDAAGSFTLQNIDLTILPQSSQPPISAMAGMSGYFQAWYRDSGGTVGNHFTDAICVTWL